MKKLFITMILLQAVIMNSFSQTDTAKDSVVRIPRSISAKIIRDLIRYDQLKELVPALEREVFLYEKILNEKDTIISRQAIIINNQHAIKKEIDLRLKQSEKQIRKQKTLKWLAIVGGIVSTGTAIYLLK